MTDRSAGQYLTYYFLGITFYLNLLYTTSLSDFQLFSYLVLRLASCHPPAAWNHLPICLSSWETLTETHNVPYENSVDLHNPLKLS